MQQFFISLSTGSTFSKLTVNEAEILQKFSGVDPQTR